MTLMSVKGTYQDGVIQLDQPVAQPNGQAVIVIFIDNENDGSDEAKNTSSWDELNQLLEDCAIATGISDLAYQHDHYLHGTPKHEGNL